MNELLINPRTQLAVDAYLREPTHALLLVGQHGVGLSRLASVLAKKVSGKSIVTISPKLHKSQKTANINTGDIRDLTQITHTRRKDPLVIIIDEAEKMTAGAPEAFLKALEEPVEQIYYILTSHDTSNLPKTILSRSQVIDVLPSDTTSLVGNIKPHLKQRQIEFIANGLPAEIQRLSDDDAYFRSKAKLFEQAKNYLSGGVYEKLAVVPKLKTRDDAIEFLLAVSRLARMKPVNPKGLTVLSDVLDNLSRNGNVKAQMTYLATNW